MIDSLTRTPARIPTQPAAGPQTRFGLAFEFESKTEVQIIDGKIEPCIKDHVKNADLFGDGRGYVLGLDEAASIITSDPFAQAKEQLENGAAKAELKLGDSRWTAVRSETGDYLLDKESDGLPFCNSVTVSSKGDTASVRLSGRGYGGSSFNQALYGKVDGSGVLTCLEETIYTRPHLPGPSFPLLGAIR
jgi:hypothetical protein